MTEKGETKIQGYRVQLLRQRVSTEGIDHIRGIVLYPESKSKQTPPFSDIRIHFVEDSNELGGGVNQEDETKLDPIMPISDFNPIYELLRSAFDNKYDYIRCHWALKLVEKELKKELKLVSFSVDGERMKKKPKRKR